MRKSNENFQQQIDDEKEFEEIKHKKPIILKAKTTKPKAISNIQTKIPRPKIISPKRSSSRKSNIPKLRKSPKKESKTPNSDRKPATQNLLSTTGTTDEENKIRERALRIREQTEALKERRYREVQFAAEDIELKRMFQADAYKQAMSRLYYDSLSGQ